jgi:hypothetical protein
MVAESTTKFEVIDGYVIIDWFDSIWEYVPVTEGINSHGSVLSGLESELFSRDGEIRRSLANRSWPELTLLT